MANQPDQFIDVAGIITTRHSKTISSRRNDYRKGDPILRIAWRYDLTTFENHIRVALAFLAKYDLDWEISPWVVYNGKSATFAVTMHELLHSKKNIQGWTSKITKQKEIK